MVVSHDFLVCNFRPRFSGGHSEEQIREELVEFQCHTGRADLVAACQTEVEICTGKPSLLVIL